MLSLKLSTMSCVIDLKSRHHFRSAGTRKRRHEQRTGFVYATDGSSAPARIPQMRRALRRQSSSSQFLLLGPVSLYGVCPVELPRESARHRGLPAFAAAPTLSPGHSRHRLAQHVGRCQRIPRLAHLRRLRPSADPGGTASPSGRGLGRGSEQHGVRAGSTIIDLCLTLLSSRTCITSLLAERSSRCLARSTIGFPRSPAV